MSGSQWSWWYDPGFPQSSQGSPRRWANIRYALERPAAADTSSPLELFLPSWERLSGLTPYTLQQFDASCLYCGSPAIDMHHYRPENPSQGKGMAGGHHDLPTGALCREHHQGLHDKRWVLEVENGIAFGFQSDGSGDWPFDSKTLFERPLELDDSHAEPEFWSLQKLATDIVEVNAQRYYDIGRRCAVFWARARWFPDWPKAAAHAIRETTGHEYSPRAIRDLANGYLLLRDAPETYELLGRTLAGIAGSAKGDRPALLEKFTRQRGEGMSVKEILAEHRDTVSKPIDDCVVHCRTCDREIPHRRRVVHEGGLERHDYELGRTTDAS